MPLFDVVILALVQGATEFLPVSSSGHLLAARMLFGLSDEQGNSLDAFLHLGTLLAVLVYYWRVWWEIIHSAVSSGGEEVRSKRQLLSKIILATIPAALVGYFLQDVVATSLRSPTSLSLALVVTAGALWLFDRLATSSQAHHRASYKDAFIIGLVQMLALVPGISRSGITIAAGRGRGLSRRQATTFSFLLSAPLIAGAGLNSFTVLTTSSAIVSLTVLAAGFLISFLSGLGAIYLVMKMVERVSFTPFVIYLLALAGVIFLHG